MREFFFELLPKYLPFLLEGAVVTLQLSVISMVAGIAIGLLCALGAMSNQPLVRWGVAIYVEIMRNVPLLVVLVITLPAFTVSIAFRAALSEVSELVVPVATTLNTLGATVFEVSTSLTLSVPLVLKAVSVSLSVLAALSLPTTLMTGASLEPVMLTVTVSVAVAGVPLLSVALTVYCRISVSPAAK